MFADGIGCGYGVCDIAKDGNYQFLPNTKLVSIGQAVDFGQNLPAKAVTTGNCCQMQTASI